MKLSSLLPFILISSAALPCAAQDLASLQNSPPSIHASLLGSGQIAPLSELNEAQFAPAGPAAPSAQSGESSRASSSPPAAINADTAGHEVELFIGSGVGIDGFSSGNPIMNAGARYGWLLTDRKSERFYSNRFEFAVELAPLFVAWQPSGPAYGFNFYAFVLKWNFKPQGRIEPYFEIAGGAVITNKQIPPGVNSFNFTPTASAGIRILRGKYAWSIGFRWLHISDAGITQLNPGDDTIGIRIGFSRWLK